MRTRNLQNRTNTLQYYKPIKSSNNNNSNNTLQIFPLISPSSSPNMTERRKRFTISYQSPFTPQTSPKHQSTIHSNQYNSRNKIKHIFEHVDSNKKTKSTSFKTNRNFYPFNKQRFPIFIDAFKKHLHDNIYKINDNLLSNLNKVKKLKRSCSVEDYQHHLLLNSKHILSKHSFDDIIKSFYQIRKINRTENVNYISFIKKLEKQERKIINKFIKHEDHSIELLQRFGHKVNGFEYQKIKFRKVIIK